ncbi:FAD/NAD(P)-binding oxidoreductase [Alteromonas gracilis]
MPGKQHHSVVVIGGGTAGIAVAARLMRRGEKDVAVIEPSETHYYQPLWTLVGGGCAPAQESKRAMASLMPKGVTWVRDRADGVDPDAQTVSLGSGGVVSYDHLVVCPGIQLDFGKVDGMSEAMNEPAVSSNYLLESAPDTWRNIQSTRGGTAVFTMPAGPIKCAGAPQKIAYLAADYWRQQGTLRDTRVVLVLPTPGMFGVKVFADQLEKVVADYGIEVHKNSELISIDGGGRQAVIRDNTDQSTTTIDFDMAHVVPPQSAPDWVKATSLADPENPAGYVQVDKHTMQHVRYPNVFALGDAGSTPNSKTGAAIRKQYPVVVDNLLAQKSGASVDGSYGGYASCPLTTSRSRMLLAEFDYTMQPAPSIPLIDTTKPRKDMWLLKRRGLPALYWNAMMKGLG